jgi:hypothetical protein
MRRDMKDLIVDTGRWKPQRSKLHYSRAKTLTSRDLTEDEEGDLVDETDHPEKGGMRRNYRNRKEFGDRTQPLYRFLKSCINRPWDEVYSEICGVVPKNSTTNLHVHEHVHGYVLKGCEIRDGELYDPSARSPLWTTSRETLYVDSEGILRKWTPKPKAPREEEKDQHFVSKEQMLLKVKGVWYLYQFDPAKAPEEFTKRIYWGANPGDFGKHEVSEHLAILNRVKYKYDLSLEGRWERHKQLSTKEIKKYGLDQ